MKELNLSLASLVHSAKIHSRVRKGPVSKEGCLYPLPKARYKTLQATE